MPNEISGKLLFSSVLRGSILAALLTTGCVINKPPEYESAAVTAVCAARSGDSVSVSHLGVTKLVTVHIVNSWQELNHRCGVTGGACVTRSSAWNTVYEYCQKTGGDCVALQKKAVSNIYLIDDRRCLQHASHELGHVFDIPNLDTFARAANLSSAVVSR